MFNIHLARFEPFVVGFVTAALLLSPAVPALSWLRKASSPNEPDGSRTDGGQNELLRGSKAAEMFLKETKD